MFSSFRQSMAWLHTWVGLLLGFVLMVCFFFGSLSVFDREIDRWAIPSTRFAPQPLPSFDAVLRPVVEQLEPDPVEYAQQMPLLHDPASGPATPRKALALDEAWVYTTHRDPVLAMGAGFLVPHPLDPDAENHIHARRVSVDPRTGHIVPDDYLRIGSDFFYPMHYSLHWNWKNLGVWIVGLAAFSMLVALVTGVVVHRRFFREFFTFRPHKHRHRSVLDLHNLTGVVALPFHFFFAFTGLVIFAGFYYLPLSQTQLAPLHAQHEVHESAETGLPHGRSGVAAPLASVDAMVAEAKRRWAARDMAGEVGFLTLSHMGDANGVVSVFRAGSDRVALVGEGIHFRASTGVVMHEDPPRPVVSELHEFLTGLHLQHFEHWLLRWLYVLGGLLGCACIATGFVFFTGKRRAQHARAGLGGSRWVEALAVASVSGMVLATVGMLLANRLLPESLPGKGSWEEGIFAAIWFLALLHAGWRTAPVAQDHPHPAWFEQCVAIATVAVAAVVANAVTTGQHLVWTLFVEPYWPVAGVDLALLATALAAAGIARRLVHRPKWSHPANRADNRPVAGAAVLTPRGRESGHV